MVLQPPCRVVVFKYFVLNFSGVEEKYMLNFGGETWRKESMGVTIKMNFEEIRWESMDRIHLAQNTDKWGGGGGLL